jgi:phosphonate transport system substrate-binding protein
MEVINSARRLFFAQLALCPGCARLGKSLASVTVAAALLVFPVVVRAASTPKSVTIGFIPGENPQLLKENGEVIAQLLEAKIGVPVKIYVSSDYTGLIDAMKAKKIDFAFYSAMTFVFAEKMAGAKVLLKKVWEGPYYYSTILASGDSKIKKLSQLKGKKFAFVDQKSASGFLYPQVYFKKNNIDPKTFFKETVFSGNHPESVRLLRDGEVDAIAVFSNDAKNKDTAWNRFPSKDGKNGPKPKTIWVSAPIPNDPFCVRQDFYDTNPKISTDLMFALRDLDEDTNEGAKFKKLLNITGLMLATSQQYDPVRELVKELDLKLDGTK